MEQLIIRVMDGDNKPLLGEEYQKRDHRDGIMKHYQLHEVIREQSIVGFHSEKGHATWTEITYNLKEIEPII